MKKINFSEEAGIDKNKWSVSETAKQLGVKLSYRQFPAISDQEIEVWENVPEPWNMNPSRYRKAFSEYFSHGGGLNADARTG